MGRSLLAPGTANTDGHLRNAGLSALSVLSFLANKNQGALKVFHKPQHPTGLPEDGKVWDLKCAS